MKNTGNFHLHRSDKNINNLQIVDITLQVQTDDPPYENLIIKMKISKYDQNKDWDVKSTNLIRAVDKRAVCKLFQSSFRSCMYLHMQRKQKKFDAIPGCELQVASLFQQRFDLFRELRVTLQILNFEIHLEIRVISHILQGSIRFMSYELLFITELRAIYNFYIVF